MIKHTHHIRPNSNCKASASYSRFPIQPRSNLVHHSTNLPPLHPPPYSQILTRPPNSSLLPTKRSHANSCGVIQSLYNSLDSFAGVWCCKSGPRSGWLDNFDRGRGISGILGIPNLMCLRSSGGTGLAGAASLMVGLALIHAVVSWREVRRKKRGFIFIGERLLWS